MLPRFAYPTAVTAYKNSETKQEPLGIGPTKAGEEAFIVPSSFGAKGLAASAGRAPKDDRPTKAGIKQHLQELAAADTAILPAKTIDDEKRKSSKYLRIAASIREVGLIEPLVVHSIAGDAGQYLLQDGHLRFDILVAQGTLVVECLVSLDDESFTYNHKVNHLPALQEHFMIIKAIENGVSEDEIARSLNLDVSRIRFKRDLLCGICPEAVEILKDTVASAAGLRQYRRVKPLRQIEMAELMRAARNYSENYAKCLVAATPQDQLVEAEQPKEVGDLSPEDVARMEREMATLSQDFRGIEESHGINVLNLVIAAAYLRMLLDNARVVKYLAHDYPEIMTEFQKIAESRSLADSAYDTGQQTK